ncbi:FAD-dependent monooxygenase [Marinomonas algicola]|uniref:FAD-dependent monooxygenase n=1 Tax=Marinomonas algicola TaxID=2773454 RepID=UPI0019D6356E|nr:FAD-dependent monooxygenase [Marinomonas algicola]
MIKTKKIAIIGAGVAGMALAILATKQGHKVSLYERNSQISTLGAGVTLWPNAVFVLRQMELEKAAIKLGGVPHFMHQFNQNGKKQSEFDIKAINALCGFNSVTLLRRDLIALMAHKLSKLGVKTHFNHSIDLLNIEAFKQRFDLVVGADGRMNSVVRQSIHSENAIPRYQGFINIIGISQLKEKNLGREISDFRGQEERFGIVPIKNNLCFWAGAWNTEINKTRALSSWCEELHQRFSHWPQPVQNVLKSYDKTSLNRIFVHDIDPLPYWHKGNSLIIGDAAHAPLPTSGQGACQALEDAWHLVKFLQENAQLEQALAAFYKHRITKTNTTQAIGRQLAKQIFSPSNDNSTPKSAALTVAPELLSQLWMQGLEI